MDKYLTKSQEDNNVRNTKSECNGDQSTHGNSDPIYFISAYQSIE